MIETLVLVPGLCLLFGGVLGYRLGRDKAVLLDKIRKLEDRVTEPEAKPAVTLGVYEKPKPVDSSDRKVGVAEPKTPQQLAWEAEQQVERQALGR